MIHDVWYKRSSRGMCSSKLGDVHSVKLTFVRRSERTDEAAPLAEVRTERVRWRVV